MLMNVPAQRLDVRDHDVLKYSKSVGDPLELDEAERTGTGRAEKNEAGRLGQRAVFGFRPLDAAGSPQHVEIAHGARTGFRIRRDRLRYDPFDNDQLAAGWKRIAAIAQDDPATIVLPIVDDALHHDRVGAAWDPFETVRYLGIGVDDALAIAEQVDV